MTQLTKKRAITPRVLLFDGECAVCRAIAHWVQTSLQRSDASTMTVQPIGDDPKALRSLNPSLDIWDAYATIHMLMPDGSMKVGGEAVAEVLRSLPATKWFAWVFTIRIFSIRPFQIVLNVGYTVLADVRPLLGCESCGTSNFLVKVLKSIIDLARSSVSGGMHHSPRTPPQRA